MKRKIKKVLIYVCIGAVLFFIYSVASSMLFVQPTNDRDNKDSDKRREMIGTILKCGDLAPIPSGATIKEIKTEGNSFTRSFRLIFTSDDKRIKEWLSNSKGTRAVNATKIGNTSKYVLNPKCGFQYAEILVDHQTKIVTVYIEHS